MRQIVHWTVPINDVPHEIGGGRITGMGMFDSDPVNVHVWTVEQDGEHASRPRKVQIFVTGVELPSNVWIRGTVLHPSPAGFLGSMIASGLDRKLAWHLGEFK